MKYVINFQDWAYEKYAELMYTPIYHSFEIVHFNNVVVLINKKTLKISIAKCHPDDIFDLPVGIGVAYARYNGLDIPKETKAVPIKTLSHGAKFVKCADDINLTSAHRYCLGKSPLNKNDCCYIDNKYHLFLASNKMEVFPI